MRKTERLLTAAGAKALDKKAWEKFGITTLVLMENAGRVVTDAVIKILQRKPGKIAVFCGTGNNGGDGFCTVRHLLAAGIKPDVYLIGKQEDVQNEAKINLDILLRLKQKIIKIKPENLSLINNKINNYSLIIDALLGVGIKGEVRPIYKQIIDIINASGAYILSVDIPSGLDATEGKILGACVKADETVTFVGKKRGMIYGDGKKYCGKIIVRNIGVRL